VPREPKSPGETQRKPGEAREAQGKPRGSQGKLRGCLAEEPQKKIIKLSSS